MQGRAKPLSLLKWTRTLLSPAIRRPPMSATVSQMWRTSCPVTTLINAVCFAWPAIEREIRCQAGFRRVARTNGTVRKTEGLAGAMGDESQELFFLGRLWLPCNGCLQSDGSVLLQLRHCHRNRRRATDSPPLRPIVQAVQDGRIDRDGDHAFLPCPFDRLPAVRCLINEIVDVVLCRNYCRNCGRST